jgi:hypothetical protein
MSRIVIDETKTIAAGGVTVSIKAEPLVFETPDNLGATEAAAIVEGIANGIRAITKMSRDGKHRLFNRTGTLANELAAILGANGYDVVAPPGYLQDDELMQQLIDLVPAIADPTTLRELQAAIEKTAAAMVRVGQ